MWDRPDDEELAWAEICLDHPALRDRARDSGRLGEFTALTEASRAGLATLAAWHGLIEQIEKHERSTADHEIRDGPDDEYVEPDDDLVPVAYGCPDEARACRRHEIVGESLPPAHCHLTGKEMHRRSERA
jgi:hypothetical protein